MNIEIYINWLIFITVFLNSILLIPLIKEGRIGSYILGLLFSIIPVVGQLFTILSSMDVIQKLKNGNTKCLFGHNFKVVYNSATEFHKAAMNGKRRGIRAPLGCYVKYQCVNEGCSETHTEKECYF